MPEYEEWVPGRSNNIIFKMLASPHYDAEDVETTEDIDGPNDIDFPYGTDPATVTDLDINNTRLLPCEAFQFSFTTLIDFEQGPYRSTSAMVADSYYLMSVGTGDWISGFMEASKLYPEWSPAECMKWRSRSRYTNESFRCIFRLRVEGTPSLDYSQLGSIFGSANQILDRNTPLMNSEVITDFWVVKFDNSVKFDNIFNEKKQFPYNSDGDFTSDDYRFNRVLGTIPDGYRFNVITDVVLPSQTSLKFTLTFPMLVSVNTTSDTRLGWKYKELIQDKKTGLYKYADPKTVLIPIDIDNAKLRLYKLKERMRGSAYGDFKQLGMRTRKPGFAPFLHNNYDRVLGYDLSSYVDKKRNIMLAFSKDGISWQNKVQIAATDPSAGEFPNTLTRGDGVTTLIWQKFGNNRATTLGTGNFVLPTGGIGAAGHGIWQTPVNYIHDADTGPIFFQSKDDNAITREENLIVAGGKNPVIVADGGLGVDNLFYWMPARYCTGGTAGITLQCYAYRETGTVPVTLGAVCVTISKDGETWSDKPVLVLPTPVDDSTKIPQQSVGVSIKGSGNFLISWVDKDGEAHQDVINLLEKNAVSK